MPPFAVNVRAIVTAEALSPDASGEVPGWEIYDTETNAEGQTVIRCDQLVRVDSEDREKAVKDAIAAAGAIDLGEGWEVEGVHLWVDEGIDIDPEFAETSPGPR